MVEVEKGYKKLAIEWKRGLQKTLIPAVKKKLVFQNICVYIGCRHETYIKNNFSNN